MKHLAIILSCIIMIFGCTACSTDHLLSYFPFSENTEETTTEDSSQRTYIDEISGTIYSFDGSFLTVISKDNNYTFDISQSTVETSQGLIAGDTVNIIYEGQLEEDDTSKVSVLKIVDDIHKKSNLNPVTITGKLTAVSQNSITLETAEQTYSFPITGVDQQYQNGLHTGIDLWVTYIGDPALNSSLVKVLSVSDFDPAGDNSIHKNTDHSVIRGYISRITDHTITVRLKGHSDFTSVDLTSVPCVFHGGVNYRAGINFYYTGEYNGENTEGITITFAESDDYSQVQTRKIAASVSGTIQGSTDNTFSILTNDGTFLICSSVNITDSSTGGLTIGSSVNVTYDPTASKNSNILQSIKIQDA